jgi:hypothetical protein
MNPPELKAAQRLENQRHGLSTIRAEPNTVEEWSDRHRVALVSTPQHDFVMAAGTPPSESPKAPSVCLISYPVRHDQDGETMLYAWFVYEP